MRTLIDLPEDDIKALDMIGKKEDLSRAELVRRAVARYLEEEQDAAKNDVDKYFGLFKDDPTAFDGLSGLEYQQKMRDEWGVRDDDIDSRRQNYRGFNDSR